LGETLSTFPVLTIGLSEQAKSVVAGVFSPESIQVLEYDVEKIMDSNLQPPPLMVAIGAPPEGLALTEMAQMLRMQFPAIPIFYTTTVRVGFDKRTLAKNGFTDCFLLPFESPVFETRLKDELSIASKGRIKSYKAVKLLDLAPGVNLDFDVSMYLPANKKYIKLTQSGDEMDARLVEKLGKSQMNSLFVEREQMKNFYEFTAKQLGNIESSDKYSVTEKTEKLKTAVRDLMADVFSDALSDDTVAKGRTIADDCGEIVKAFISNDTKGVGGWYARMLKAVGGESGSYSRAANISTYGTLFALGMGLSTAKDVGVAGLLHDIGMADLPLDIQAKSEEDLTPVEQIAFYKHPQYSLEMIRNRKMIVSPLVMTIIEQHHEWFNGRGLPNKLPGHRLRKESQLLGLAIQFENLTGLSEGRKQYTPAEAWQKVQQEAGDPAMMRYDPDIIKQIAALFRGSPQ
jgi:HD-GYP domain-containing protein (c-di-GMP phosphodiesterase class II)